MATPINEMKFVAGVSASTLRRWEREGVLAFRPSRDAVGRRVFSDDEVEVVRRLLLKRQSVARNAINGRGRR